MDRILCGSKPEISNLLGHPHFLRGRNCLGQTATHVAVLRPDVLFTLLQFDVADIDGADFCGNSPLDYAAAYGYTDSVIELLKAGADPLEDGHLKFLHWAFFWDRWDVAKEAFAFFRATTRFSAAFLRSELHHFMGKVQGRGWRRSPELLETMLTLGVDKHIIFQNGNTLLHSATDSKWINCLFNAGFQEIDHRNNEGETALMKFILYQRDLRLVRHILTRGCSVNHRNNRGQTSLHGAFAQSRFSLPQRKQTFTLSFFDKITATHKFRFFDSISEGLATIARLLHHGADASIRDNCRCPCAPDGCSPVRKLLAGGKSKSYIWIMECLLMLIDVQGRTIAQKALFEINRVREFQLADMTHVCCNTADMTNVCSNALYYGTPMDDAEADEILDEEKEFVALLENKRGEAATSSDKNSIEKSWLSLISDFWIPNKPLKREKYMVRFNPQSMAGSGPGRALTSNNPLWNGKETLDFILAEEEEDNYWILLEGIDGHLMPQSSIYLAWVEWVYKNPEKYDYPFPVDRNWYERRKYWATRQAEVLDGLS
jgi:ankyrin repeat protein